VTVTLYSPGFHPGRAIKVTSRGVTTMPTLRPTPSLTTRPASVAPSHLLATLALLLASPICLAQVGLAQAPALEEHSFESDGVTLRYVTAGNGGLPLVLVHGFTASVETNWLLPGILPKLAENFQIIALDARGHGKSGKPHDPEVYGEQMAKDVINLLDHLELPFSYIAGYSMGGFITLKALTMAPDRFLGAALGGAGWMVPGEGTDLHLRLAESLENGEGIGPLIEALNPPGEPLAPERIAMSNQMLLATNDPLALAAVARGMGGLAIDGAALDKIEVPILAVVGSRDPLQASVMMLKTRKPDVQMKVIDGADHLTAVSSPELATAMQEFFVGACKCAE
jgi:pimeloyl-ACP methyl ester carboxylesterase